MKPLMSIAKITIAGAILSLAASAGTPARASMIGSTISGDYTYSNDPSFTAFNFTPSSFLVADPTIESELIVGVTRFDVDFSANALTLTSKNNTSFTSATFNGPVFTSDGLFGAASVNYSGVSASVVGHMLYINWAGMSFSPSDTITVNFANVASATPLPSASGMMILGLAGIGYIAYRRKRNGVQFRMA